MPSVNGAKSKWANNTDWNRVQQGYDRFLEESGAASLQEAWEDSVQGADYSGGVEAFLQSEGGIEDAQVTEDYDWEAQTLSGGSNWESDATGTQARTNFENRTDEANADKWFDSYASSFGAQE